MIATQQKYIVRLTRTPVYENILLQRKIAKEQEYEREYLEWRRKQDELDAITIAEQEREIDEELARIQAEKKSQVPATASTWVKDATSKAVLKIEDVLAEDENKQQVLEFVSGQSKKKTIFKKRRVQSKKPKKQVVEKTVVDFSQFEADTDLKNQISKAVEKQKDEEEKKEKEREEKKDEKQDEDDEEEEIIPYSLVISNKNRMTDQEFAKHLGLDAMMFVKQKEEEEKKFKADRQKRREELEKIREEKKKAEEEKKKLKEEEQKKLENQRKKQTKLLKKEEEEKRKRIEEEKRLAKLRKPCKCVLKRTMCEDEKCGFAHTFEAYAPIACKIKKCVNMRCWYMHSNEDKETMCQRMRLFGRKPVLVVRSAPWVGYKPVSSEAPAFEFKVQVPVTPITPSIPIKRKAFRFCSHSLKNKCYHKSCGFAHCFEEMDFCGFGERCKHIATCQYKHPQDTTVELFNKRTGQNIPDIKQVQAQPQQPQQPKPQQPQGAPLKFKFCIHFSKNPTACPKGKACGFAHCYTDLTMCRYGNRCKDLYGGTRGSCILRHQCDVTPLHYTTRTGFKIPQHMAN